MTADEIDNVLEALVETLAAVEHERWAHWQQYLHQQGLRQPDGSLILTADLVAKWERQIATNYPDLSDPEKNSDREQVRRYLPIIAAALKSTSLQAREPDKT